MRWASARCKSQRRKAGSSQAWIGMAERGGAWQGKARPDCVRGMARLGKGHRRWHGGSSLPAILTGGYGLARKR